MTGLAQQERTALADLMVVVGPDAPTLCAGWTTRDLAAHLVVRATRVDAAAGIVIKALARHARAVQDRVAAQDWSRLVEQVRRRPWWAFAADEAANRIEYFIHHEDVRRAQDGWRPRELSGELSAALWSRARFLARLALRRTPAAVTVSAPGFGSVRAGKARSGGGSGGAPEVDLSGPPQELVLFLTGRQAHSRVRLDGPEPITNRMRTARFGI